MNGEKKRELFKDFLTKNKVLLVDKSSASRRRLVKTLVDMGCKRSQIFSVGHYSEALDIVNSERPKLVLSDYAIPGGSGFDLFKQYRFMEKELSDTTLVLVTSNIGQSAVAKAAEEDVDSFIIKPYTVRSLEKSLISAVINKLYPSKYMKIIDQGKKELMEGDYEKALVTFESAISISKTASLAYFYHGQVQNLIGQRDEAKGDYVQGLSENKIHFKCQVGLFDLYMQEENFIEAYSVVRRIAKYFPANPDRLKQVIRLAVITENYEDMVEYHEVFTNLDERPREVVDHVCSGLWVLGRYYFYKGDKLAGRDAFEKLAVSCMGDAKFLKAMVGKFVEERMFDEAGDVLKRYPAGSDQDEAFLVSKYLAFSGRMSVAEKVSAGLELFNNGLRDPQAAAIMVEALFEAGSNKAQEYLEESQGLWPEDFRAPKAACA